jgi:hypothetical protein
MASSLARVAALAVLVAVVIALLLSSTSPLEAESQYDYIVIGGGSTGSVVAGRLGQAGFSVLVLEAGGPTQHASVGFDADNDSAPSWGGAALQFPRIQGADCCGHIVALGAGVDSARIGQRILVRPVLRKAGAASYDFDYFGSECDGGFAQYTRVAASAAMPVQSQLSDAELACLPCA